MKYYKKGKYQTLKEYVEEEMFNGTRDLFLSSFYSLLDDQSIAHKKAVEEKINSLPLTLHAYTADSLNPLIKKEVNNENAQNYLLCAAENLRFTSSYSLYHFLHDEKTDFQIDGLKEAANYLRFAAKNHIPISLYADYDADGIGVSYIGIKIMERLGVDPRLFRVYVPRRFSDGYGLTVQAVQTMPPHSLLITGDNGIAAIPAIKLAKEKGMKVIILDHHHKGSILPPADIIIDPEAFPYKAAFSGYCGAGLFYRLYQELFGAVDDSLITSMAAVSTIADSVPLLAENRIIVSNGIKILNESSGVPAFTWLLSNFNMDGHVRAEDLSFSMIPCLNAPGRLDDFGAGNVVNTLLLSMNDPRFCDSLCYMFEKNNERKSLTKELMREIKIDENDKVNFIIAPTGFPGLYGLVASKLTEQTGKPSFVMGEKEGGILSGSARSDNEKTNSVKNILASVKDDLCAFGGHDGAAGFSLKRENYQLVKDKINKLSITPHTDEYFYDLEISPLEIEQTLVDLSKYEPFGKNFRRPIFKMEVHLKEDDIRIIGAEKTTLSFQLSNCKAILFHEAEAYKEKGCPKDLYLYGYPEWNYFRGTKTLNFRMIGYDVME